MVTAAVVVVMVDDEDMAGRIWTSERYCEEAYVAVERRLVDVMPFRVDVM